MLIFTDTLFLKIFELQKKKLKIKNTIINNIGNGIHINIQIFNNILFIKYFNLFHSYFNRLKYFLKLK